jgi:hypothetical protein
MQENCAVGISGGSCFKETAVHGLELGVPASVAGVVVAVVPSTSVTIEFEGVPSASF